MHSHASAETISLRAEHAQQTELADRIARLAPEDGMHPTAIPQLYLVRISSPQPCSPVLYEPRLGVIAQGSKLVMLSGETYRCDPLHYLVVSMTLPVIGQVIEATPEKPYLSLRLDIDLDELSALMLDAEPPAHNIDRGLYVARADISLLDASLRLMRLLENPRDLRVLAPASLREIFYRVLIGDLGHRLRDLATAGSRSNRIARAVSYLRERYQQPLIIDELARTLHMSASSLHHQFKAATTMSPLQFQKQLRLHEARRLMLMEGLEANTAAHRVGYESPSQFSREYKRLFGAPPRAEIVQVRASRSA
ncbi:AraC family transcriptional regulator [Luteimonas gilva]|uniref:AraC family transcriptional regulator n=1 Tax=Luteimonas gilva TaxID=2572684 RepID=A0A4U5K2F3_9GAMM|nr:AraC family transcriptional regulator [Luteimonas gilva]TKR33139.1 AraC family transcriptional regulator [Luteimonas gilva]